jgi:hypothetical protein
MLKIKQSNLKYINNSNDDKYLNVKVKILFIKNIHIKNFI